MSTYTSVFAVAGTWLLLGVIVAGVGLLVRRVFGRGPETVDDLLLAPWIGWGAAIAFLQIWHVSHPVTAWALLAVVVAGAVGLLAHARPLARLLTGRVRAAFAAAGVIALAALWLANQSVMQPQVYDGGLYHLNAVRWAREYPLIPGLGNLHARLAFNNSSFLYTALLDAGPFQHRSHQLASGFLMLLLLVPCLHGAWRVVRGTADSRSTFRALFTAPLLVWIVNSGYASTPSPDVPVFLLTVLLAGELLAALEQAPDPGRRGFEPFAGICFLALVGVTVKLSFAAFAATAVALAFGLQAWRVRVSERVLAAGILVTALGMLVLAPWCTRGVTLSGYPAFPGTIGVSPVEWALPAATATAMAREVQAWARQPGVPPEAVLGTWAWLGPWFRRVLHDNRLDFTLPLAVATAGLSVALWRIGRGRQRPDRRWLALLPASMGLVAWFFTAPDPRFQGAQLWALANGLLVLTLPTSCRLRVVALAAQALLVVALCANPLDFVRTWKDPGPARQVPMRACSTLSGLTVYVPVAGDQVWDSELPATPYFSSLLRLRVDGDLSRGFTKTAPGSGGASPVEPVLDPRRLPARSTP